MLIITITNGEFPNGTAALCGRSLSWMAFRRGLAGSPFSRSATLSERHSQDLIPTSWQHGVMPRLRRFCKMQALCGIAARSRRPLATPKPGK
ncbi:UNVERIFIED_CONTAM: hypothetical protein GTU68_018824 [Idotea baltica]|nr:hypothetical protein [Idotea baltica]